MKTSRATSPGLVQIVGAQRSRGHRRAFVKDRASKSFTFRLTSTAWERLEELRRLVGAKSTSEVIHKALASYDLLVEYLNQGFTVRFDKNDEDGESKQSSLASASDYLSSEQAAQEIRNLIRAN